MKVRTTDLIGRKLARDEVVDATALIVDMEAELVRLCSRNGPDLSTIGAALGAGVTSFQAALKWRLVNQDAKLREAAAGAVPSLKSAGSNDSQVQGSAGYRPL